MSSPSREALKTVALCAGLRDAAALSARLAREDGIDFRLLVVNERARPRSIFVLVLLAQVLRAHPRAQGHLLRAAVRGRLKITSRELNQPAVLRWIRAANADVGL